MNISAIDSLVAIVDGDTIVPGIGYVMPSGAKSTTQYYNPSTKVCTPDYTKTANQIIIYPENYSSLNGKFIQPDANSEQWYYKNPDSDTAKILDGNGGSVLSKYSALFQKTTYQVNNMTFPALKIIGNLASADNLSDVNIYCVCTCNGMAVTSRATFPLKQSVGDAFEVVINSINESGVNDTVIDNDSEYLVLNADFQNAGVTVSPTGTWSWKKLTKDGIVAVSHVAGVTELSNSNKTLKLFDAGVSGTEEYFAVVTHNSQTYMKGQTVSDTHDPYYINIGRNTKSNLVKKGETVTYTPTVLDRSSRTVQSGWAFSFVAFDNSNTTKQSSSNATSFSVTGDNIATWLGCHVQITASKS